MLRSLRKSSLLLIALAAIAQDAAAQTESGSASRIGPPVAVWGSGNMRVDDDGMVAEALRANVSVGAWLLTYRRGDIHPTSGAGTSVHDEALLAGLRTGGHRLFASGALGWARATPYYRRNEPIVNALAYDATLHANAYVIGLALCISGAIGPNASNSAVTIGIETGWFGR